MSEADRPQLPDDPWQALEIAETDRTAKQKEDLRRLFIESGSAPEDLVQSVAEARSLENRIRGLASRQVNVMVMREMPNRRTTHVLDRGSYDQPGEVVEAGVPAILGGWSEAFPSNRLGFARWLVAEEHPLTSRVAVNRWWQALSLIHI